MMLKCMFINPVYKSTCKKLFLLIDLSLYLLYTKGTLTIEIKIIFQKCVLLVYKASNSALDEEKNVFDMAFAWRASHGRVTIHFIKP